MIKICCYCKKQFGDRMKPPPGLPPGCISHGICKDCAPIADAELDAMIAKNKQHVHHGQWHGPEWLPDCEAEVGNLTMSPDWIMVDCPDCLNGRKK